MRLPEPQSNCVEGVVTNNWRIVGSDHDSLSAFPKGPFDTVVPNFFHVAVEPDFVLHIQPLDLPRVPLIEPVIGLLDLVAISHGLLENAVGVPEPIAPAWVGHCRDRVQEACGKAPQSSVAECWVDLLLKKLL